jgi:hypothetical protein
VNFEGAVSTAEFCHHLHPSNGLIASRSGDLGSHSITTEFIILSKPVKTGSAQADLVIFEGAVSTVEFCHQPHPSNGFGAGRPCDFRRRGFNRHLISPPPFWIWKIWEGSGVGLGVGFPCGENYLFIYFKHSNYGLVAPSLKVSMA